MWAQMSWYAKRPIYYSITNCWRLQVASFRARMPADLSHAVSFSLCIPRSKRRSPPIRTSTSILPLPPSIAKDDPGETSNQRTRPLRCSVCTYMGAWHIWGKSVASNAELSFPLKWDGHKAQQKVFISLSIKSTIQVKLCLVKKKREKFYLYVKHHMFATPMGLLFMCQGFRCGLESRGGRETSLHSLRIHSSSLSSEGDSVTSSNYTQGRDSRESGGPWIPINYVWAFAVLT